MPCQCQCHHCPFAFPQYWSIQDGRVWAPISCHCLGEAKPGPSLHISHGSVTCNFVSEPRPNTSEPAAPRSGTGRERPAPWGLLMFVCSLPPPLPFSFNLHRHACFACLRSDGVSHIPNCCCLAPCRRSIWKCSSFHFRTYSDMGS
jgi:hypothetical protein